MHSKGLLVADEHRYDSAATGPAVGGSAEPEYTMAQQEAEMYHHIMDGGVSSSSGG